MTVAWDQILCGYFILFCLLFRLSAFGMDAVTVHQKTANQEAVNLGARAGEVSLSSALTRTQKWRPVNSVLFIFIMSFGRKEANGVV